MLSLCLNTMVVADLGAGQSAFPEPSFGSLLSRQLIRPLIFGPSTIEKSECTERSPHKYQVYPLCFNARACDGGKAAEVEPSLIGQEDVGFLFVSVRYTICLCLLSKSSSAKDYDELGNLGAGFIRRAKQTISISAYVHFT